MAVTGEAVQTSGVTTKPVLIEPFRRPDPSRRGGPSATSATSPSSGLAIPVDHDVDRYEAVKQYSLAKILGVWALAAVPMGVLAWIVAPWLRDQIGGRDPFAEALLICLTAGLIWQFVLVGILIRQEVGSTFDWPRVRDALWLRAPRDPKTGRVGGKVWWWALLFLCLFAVWAMVPTIPGPSARDLSDYIGSDRAEAFFSGAWGWYAVIVALALFNTVLGEELLFRGVLLPRMRGVFGKRDWVANGALFALYHLHMPWVILNTFVDGIFLLAYPSRRYQSAWIGIIVHSGRASSCWWSYSPSSCDEGTAACTTGRQRTGRAADCGPARVSAPRRFRPACCIPMRLDTRVVGELGPLTRCWFRPLLVFAWQR